MRPSDNFPLTVLVTAAIAIIVVAVPILFLTSEDAERAPDRSAIRAVDGEVWMIPGAAEERSAELRAGIAGLLEDLYARAFAPAGSGENEEIPALIRRLAPLFSEDALAVLAEDPAVFHANGLVVTSGEVTFNGVVTLTDTEAPQALIELRLLAEAAPESSTGQLATITQIGTVRIGRADETWRIEAFDLSLVAEAQEPAS